mmetsp:Transcript_67268/g.190726  ORF Transcript_67268/g.190726 Transcript_67268/m.190726 type:complete len:279 (+) Transcript_67268:95-931(+)
MRRLPRALSIIALQRRSGGLEAHRRAGLPRMGHVWQPLPGASHGVETLDQRDTALFEASQDVECPSRGGCSRAGAGGGGALNSCPSVGGRLKVVDILNRAQAANGIDPAADASSREIRPSSWHVWQAAPGPRVCVQTLCFDGYAICFPMVGTTHRIDLAAECGGGQSIPACWHVPQNCPLVSGRVVALGCGEKAIVVAVPTHSKNPATRRSSCKGTAPGGHAGKPAPARRRWIITLCQGEVGVFAIVAPEGVDAASQGSRSKPIPRRWHGCKVHPGAR